MSNFEYSSKKYLGELRKQYPTKSAALAEIIRLNGLLNLPKGTEHFLSDVHGEYESFSHIRKNASGVIRKKVDLIFKKELDEDECSRLASLIYYPEEKISQSRLNKKNTDAWYEITIERLLRICRLVGSKYTRKMMREILHSNAKEYVYIIEELLSEGENERKKIYCDSLIKTAIRISAADDIIIGICNSIKSLIIDHLHIVGDIFDRGPRADLILDELMKERSIDIQWGNHDVLWMGAAAGSMACIATVLNNSFTYKNIDLIEIGYGISLRPLALFAEKIYGKSDCSVFMPRGDGNGNFHGGADDLIVAKMHKAISIIQFKLEGQIIKRNPHFLMNDRLILEQIDKVKRQVLINGRKYTLLNSDFPTLNENDAYALTDEENAVMKYLYVSFMRSERLQRQIKFLYEKGGMYKVYNNNLLYHGCIPLNEDGDFLKLTAAGGRSGKALMDYCDKMARMGYFAKGEKERRAGRDFLWFLWCGKDSPLCARKKIASFERLLIDDKEAWIEPKNDYYRAWDNEEIAVKILREFGLSEIGSHIINGHIPINKGESPLKANGRIIVIDGGFCRAYHDSTGIGGYTLIYNSEGMALKAHQPFFDKEDAINNNADIISETVIFEHKYDKMRIRETDEGAMIRERISDLMLLNKEYDNGKI